MTTRWTAVRVLRDRTAGRCLTAVVVSGFGTSALWLASGVWVKDLTGSDGLAALCMLAMWLPTLAGPVLGTLADRHRRRPLLVTLSLCMAALLLTLCAVDAPSELWLLYAVLFVYGAAGTVHDAAESALVAGAVDRSLLGDFNGLRMTADEGMKLLAPLAGAGLYTAYGGPGVAVLDAASFLAAALVYVSLRVREERPEPAREGGRSATAEGVRHLWGDPALRPLVLAGGVTMLCAGVSGALTYAVVEDLGHSPAYAGVLYAVQGAGSVTVGLLSGPGLRRLGARRFAGYGIGLLAVAVALRAVPYDPVAWACAAAIGVGLPAALIAVLTEVQRRTPGPLLGRVTATANALVFTPNVIGLAAGAGLVELIGHRMQLTGLGAALGVTAAVLLGQRPASAGRTEARSASDASPA
ncbi:MULTISPECIES: MFS transporter [Streptomyces]|uniref:MFS family permease n=1 Tax=Streptomyces thermodiastaticus TaxID=44061 RepID=A0ABU0KK54_9ACTN|nr:MFS transporter [Streptomyces sp. McG8]MDQ0489798.1 MFS family permease [Streptomyces thermodiastaticus]MXQ60559.1 MFS transporter [Streptomyces sp. XHT-2]MYQ32754.1 MFS transporter [Streptomyces sp. SID4956]THC51162.1 MFS transporter [Streptomyces sp. Akac8]UVT09133.1 MFS transporter [Streptomyces thermocarboxydus]WSB40777.1 MFS transporter [Streptomyces cellulosae]